MSNITYNTKNLTVGLLKEILNNYPNHKGISFLYENWEEPKDVVIGINKYDGNRLVFEMKDGD